ncbi:STAS domain-containing protein [Dactylosporangium sp. NBC_01737]|uniref:STAS domain-containing protein n=1 Tax=Dactylosporangium sp. NBC_01737 TaxID=2975959 RepID=UPI002E13B4F2|nr:STAS domain-containing protein [Dactylosporangium sp. NBC_01737]
MKLSLVVRQGRDCTVVQVAGIVDLTTEQELRACLQQALDDGARHVVLDLAAVPRLDSSGLGAIVSTYKLLQQRGGQLYLVSVQPPVRNVFLLTSVDRLMGVYDTVDAAEEAVAREVR